MPVSLPMGMNHHSLMYPTVGAAQPALLPNMHQYPGQQFPQYPQLHHVTPFVDHHTNPLNVASHLHLQAQVGSNFPNS